MSKVWIYILISALVTFLVRVLPLTLIRKPIKNVFIRSFLYYVPYVTLAVMTFPAIIYASNYIIAGVAALIVGIILAWKGRSLFQVAISCCLMVVLVEGVMTIINQFMV